MDTFPELVNSSVKFKIRFVKKRELCRDRLGQDLEQKHSERWNHRTQTK